MKIAYLVVAHRNPCLLAREIATLSSDDADFFIHIDKKVPISKFAGLKRSRVTFLQERYEIHWAGFSIVRAVLALIDIALKGPQKYDYFVLLGGSEYPLRSREYIHRFFEEHKGSEFIDMVKLPNLDAGKPISHITKFAVESPTPVLRFATKVMWRLGIRRNYRKHLGAIEPYGGEMWWALSRGACEYINRFVKERREVVRFFQNVQVPDETFLQTIVGNSGFVGKVRKSILYRDWSQGGPHPAMIAERHITHFESVDKVILADAFGSGEVLFARKFSDETLGLVDRIDRFVTRKENGVGLTVN